MSLRTRDLRLSASSVEGIGIMKGTRFIGLQDAIISGLRYTGFFEYGGFKALIAIGINKS